MEKAMEHRKNYAEEILNGIRVLMAPRPLLEHARISRRISNKIEESLSGGGCEAFVEVDVYLSKNDRFVPDVCVVCDPAKYANGKRIEGAPDLVVEVLSRSTANRDRGYKKDIYELHGVKEYWIVTASECAIEVYILKDGRYYHNHTYTLMLDHELEMKTEEELKEVKYVFSPSIFPDMKIDIREIFTKPD